MGRLERETSKLESIANDLLNALQEVLVEGTGESVEEITPQPSHERALVPLAWGIWTLHRRVSEVNDLLRNALSRLEL